ncbi:MAG: glycosyltransferase [Bacteroidota bacterium]|nr:glycosyltransferase [Bacteroidota bacterium]
MTATKATIPVSLILTTKNEEANVPLFFQGVRASSVRPAEIVICDGGSDDGTVAALRREAGDLPVTIVIEAGANIARGRNRAIAEASHYVLAITDAGCIIDPFWLERITAPLLADETLHAVGGGYALVGERRVQRWTASASIPLHNCDPDSFLPSSRSFAARRLAILEAGGYPEHLTFAGEDTALVLRMKRKGHRFVTRWDAMVHWYTRPTLRSFLRQHFLYGLGDGEARSHGARYARSAAKWAALPVLLAGAVYYPPLLVLLPVLLFLYFLHLAPKYDWGKQPFSEAMGGFLFVALKEWSMLAGFLRGRLSRIKEGGV